MSKARGEEGEEGEGERKSWEGALGGRDWKEWMGREGQEVGAELEMERVLSRTAKVSAMRKVLKVKTDEH